MSRFANAIGIWELEIGNEKLELKPKMEDVVEFRDLLMNDNIRSKKQLLYTKVGEFMFGLIKKHYPEDDEEQMNEWIQINLNQILEEAMIAFKWTTRDDLIKGKKDNLQDLKKEMSSV